MIIIFVFLLVLVTTNATPSLTTMYYDIFNACF